MRKQAVIISAVVLALILIVMGVGCGAPPAKEVTIGSKDFAEQYIIGEMIKQVLEEHGFKVNLVADLSTTREGMEAGDIDICAEYSGTAWIVNLVHEREVGIDNNELYRLVKEEDEGKGFIWLNPIWNNNTFALASWPEFVEKHGLKTLSDLASLYREKKGEIKTHVGAGFPKRPDGLPALESYYDFKVAEPFLLTELKGAPQEILRKRQAEVAIAFGTDGEVSRYGWHLYVDDKAFFPTYDLAPYVRKGVLDKYPEIANILNELVSTFPGGGEPATAGIVARCQKVWQELNAKVSIDEMEPDEVAYEYLVEHGLIKE